MRQKGFYKGGSTAKFGPSLVRATIQFQDDAGVFADGIVGPITTQAAKDAGFDGFVILSNPQSLADRAGIPPEVLQAFREVESNGDSSAIRFEPHLFVRFNPRAAGTIPYTPSKHGPWSVMTKETNRAAFDRAYKIDARSAVKATSWGAFQVLGQHLLDEYDDRPDKAVQAFDEDPEKVSGILLARWFSANHRAKQYANASPPDFNRLCRMYNGPLYAKHNYHVRMRKAWLKARND
tara:strand:- start:8833 stop:9540 length:708 start_codon:yes stop_codon:yes gene_type:complete